MRITLIILFLSIISFFSCSKKEEKKESDRVKLYFLDEKYKSVEIDSNMIHELEPVEVEML